MKLTFLGDIMCEPPILKASRREDGSYNFDGVFQKVRPMLAEADYVVSNLEAPMAGEEAKYTDCFFVFNAPDAYAEAIRDAGIDLISTVNNHTLDRGADGMMRTLRVLDDIGLPHTGSFLPEKGREEAYYFEVGGVKMAVVAYTYTTNKKLPAGDENLQYINYLRDPAAPTYLPEVAKRMKTWVDKVFKKMKEEHRAVIKMCVGLPNTIERADDFMDPVTTPPYIDQMVADIKAAKEKADVVIFYPHVGGQFNPEPGMFSKYVVDKAIEAGADAVVASHSHMVQRAGVKEGIPVAYSLGNFSMSPNSTIIVKKNLPDYGLAMHLYMEDGKFVRSTVSILKMVEKRGSQMVVWPVDELYKALSGSEQEKLVKDVRWVLGVVMGKQPEGDIIRKEYELTAI